MLKVLLILIALKPGEGITQENTVVFEMKDMATCWSVAKARLAQAPNDGRIYGAGCAVAPDNNAASR
jgi:hypothetical protein